MADAVIFPHEKLVDAAVSAIPKNITSRRHEAGINLRLERGAHSCKCDHIYAGV